MIHFAQLVNSRMFRRFDYGSASENMKHYNESVPPRYDIGETASKMPSVIAYTGGADWLADPRDALDLMANLGNALHSIVNIDSYNHLDHVWGIDANQRIFKHIIEDL